MLIRKFIVKFSARKREKQQIARITQKNTAFSLAGFINLSNLCNLLFLQVLSINFPVLTVKIEERIAFRDE